MKYDQDTSFSIEIERYQSKDTGEILTYSDLTKDNDFEYKKVYFQIDVIGSADIDCIDSPELFDSVEIISIKGPDGEDWSDLIDPYEEEHIKYMIASNVALQVDENNNFYF